MNKYLQNVDSKTKYSRKRNIERYGLTVDEYNFITQVQSHQCAICREEQIRLVIDHCHKTQKVRQLLCRACNAMLGMAGDDIAVLESAIEYLKRHKNAE